MSSVDDRIVNMQFNNKQFTTGVDESKKSLSSLEKQLADMGKLKALTGMEKDVASMNKKFSVMGVVGAAAIAKLTTSAMSMGKNLIGKVLGPMASGGLTRALNIEQAKFQFSGLGMNIEKSMASALEAVKGTAYGLDSAAKLASQFGASGMKAGGDMTNALRGVAGAAAMTNTSFDEIGSIFKSIAGEGKVSAVRMEQFGTRGLNAWSALAKGMGKSETEIREMVKNREIDFETFAATMNDAFGEHATSANKTYAGSLSNVKAAMSRVGASFATAKIENHRRIFNALTPVIDNVHDALKPLIKSYEMWMNVGRRNLVRFLKPFGDENNNPFLKYSKSIENVTRLFPVMRKIISMTIRHIMDAFKEVFSGGGGSNFLKFFETASGAVLSFFRGIKNALRDGDGLKKFFIGVFTPIKMITTIIGGVISAIGAFFSALSKGTSGAAGGIGELVIELMGSLRAFGQWVNQGGRITSVFAALGTAVGSVVAPIVQGVGMISKAFAALLRGEGAAGFAAPFQEAKGAFADFVSVIFGGLSKITAPLEKVSGAFQSLRDKTQSLRDSFKGSMVKETTNDLDGLSRSASEASDRWGQVGGFLVTVGGGIKATFSALGGMFSWVSRQFKDLFGHMDALDWAAMFNALLTGGVLLSIKKFIKGLDETREMIGSFRDSAIGAFDQLTNTLKTMQSSLKAKMLRDIAIAVGLLTLSLIALSFVDPAKLAIGLGAIGTMMGMLVGSLMMLSKVNSAMTLPVLASAIVMISGAMINLAIAVAILGNLDMKTLAKGLGAMAIGLGIMVGAVKMFSGLQGAVVAAGASIMIMSVAMTALAGAVLAFGKMSLKTLAKGLGAMAIGLGVVVGALLALSFVAKESMAGAAAIALVSGAMIGLSVAVLAFGKMNLKTLAKGMGAMALGLGLMVGALLILSGNTVGVAAAAGAMMIMAAALNMLVGVILILGAAPWDVVSQGLKGMAIALGILLVAGALATVIAPGLIALGIAVGLMGAALALAGIGMFAFATGLAILVGLGTAAFAVIGAAIGTFIAMLPNIAIQVAAAFVSFLGVIAAAGPKIRKHMRTILESMLGAVRDAVGEFRKTLQTLINAGIKVVEDSAKRWASAGFAIIDHFLKEAAEHAPSIIDSVVILIETFLKGIEENSGRIMDQAAKTIIAFLDGISGAINNNVDEFARAGKDIAFALVNGLTGGLLGRGMELVRSAASRLASAIPGPIRKMLGIESPSKVTKKIGLQTAQGMAVGIRAGIKNAVDATIKMANAIIAAGNTAVGKAQKVASNAQRKAHRFDAQARVSEKKARQAQREADKFARQNPKKEKAIAARQKAVDKLQRDADKRRTKADKQQEKANRAAERVQYRKQFAEADTRGKGDMKQQEAVNLADRASRKLAEANAEAAEARKIMKTNKALGQRMLKAAQKDAKAARKLAAQAQAAAKRANQYYQQEVAERLKTLKDDAEFEKADDAGKAKILLDRAKANDAKAKAAQDSAAALMKKAEAMAKKDAAEALRLVERAEAAAAEAKAAADKAKEERDQANQILNPGGMGGGVGGSSITPSRSVLEDAARSVDRYSASLAQAQEAIAAQQTTIQYVQNNHSPEALSASEIYRQSKNLLSNAEVKMASN